MVKGYTPTWETKQMYGQAVKVAEGLWVEAQKEGMDRRFLVALIGQLEAILKRERSKVRRLGS